MRRLAVVTSVLALLSGCSVVKPPERPAWRVFALEPAAPEARAPRSDTVAANGPVVVVTTPESGVGYATRRMAYSRGGGQLEYFAEHRWADAPARMIIPLFQDALTRTGAFRAVAGAPTRVVGDLVIESELLAFRQELEGATARFRATLRVTAIHAGGATDSKQFDVLEPMNAAGPAEGVPAANRAIARVLEETAAFCAEVARRAP